MMETTLNFHSFTPNFRTGLLFSIFEGLRLGESFRLICDQNPEEFRSEFELAMIKDYKWDSHKLQNGQWEVRIVKASLDYALNERNNSFQEEK